jgi:hypothetical protein
MPKTKGTGINWLRDLIEAKGPQAEQALAKALSPEDFMAYRTAMPISWFPEEAATRIYLAAGNILFADKPDVRIEVGRGMAKANLNGIYKLLVPLATIPFLMKQSSRLWRTYHDTGVTAVEEFQGEKKIIFSVGSFPDLPPDMRQVLRGYIMGLSELVGVKNIRVALDESDPSSWKWTITWE